MRIYKMNGLGNSFAVFDARDRGALNLSAAQVKAIADPQQGLGCDQVIVLEPSIRGAAFMRIWNADGGEVAACGNATRCVAWLIMQELGALDTAIETGAGILSAEMRSPREVCVDMGSPLLRWEEIPLAERQDTRKLDLAFGDVDAPLISAPGAVNMGNPHCVFFVEDVEGLAVDRLGPLVERHPLFPQRVNAGFAQIIARDHIRLRVWERGAGLTLACGTGACAALVAAYRRGLADRAARVTLDGGDLDITWRGADDHVLMTGPITLEYATELEDAFA